MTRKTRLLHCVLMVACCGLMPRTAAANGAHGGVGWTSSRPDGHAPIGVMGDHLHHRGEVMLSYRFRLMDMDGNREGTRSLTAQDVLDAGFMVAPEDMTVQMHLFGAMVAPTDYATLMVMIPYVRLSMDHVTMSGDRFTTAADGLGDIRATALLLLRRWGRSQLHFNAGVGFPSGLVEVRDDTPAGADQKLPYPMRPGSGTFAVLPGLTLLGQSDDWSWGGQLGGVIRLGRNDDGYSLGDRGMLTVWGARRWNHWLSTSLRVDGRIWGDVAGQDDDLDPAMVPTADPDLRGGERVDLLFGLNLYGRGGFVKGHRLAAEVGVPVYQSLNGPQLETDLVLTVGWQYAW